MPTDLPFRSPDLSQPAGQADHLDTAMLSGDPFLIVLALKEIGLARRVPVALDENPHLSEVLRVLGDLGFRLWVSRLEQ